MNFMIIATQRENKNRLKRKKNRNRPVRAMASPSSQPWLGLATKSLPENYHFYAKQAKMRGARKYDLCCDVSKEIFLGGFIYSFGLVRAQTNNDPFDRHITSDIMICA